MTLRVNKVDKLILTTLLLSHVFFIMTFTNLINLNQCTIFNNNSGYIYHFGGIKFYKYINDHYQKIC